VCAAGVTWRGDAGGGVIRGGGVRRADGVRVVGPAGEAAVGEQEKRLACGRSGGRV
jgi:hypothetical protein